MNITESQINYVIRFCNMRAGTKYKFGTESNRQAVIAAIEAGNGETAPILAYIREHAGKDGRGLCSLCYDFVAETRRKAREAAETPTETPAPAPVAQAADPLASSMNLLAQVVTEMVAKTKTDDIRDTVAASLKDEVKQFILDTYGPIQRKVELQLGERKVELKGIVHEKFDEVLKFVSCDEPVLLVGPAGTGKNVICKQVAETLGLDFYFSNSVTQEYKINGFTDAMGHYQESEFYKAFTKGGLFMLDEMDASIPEVLVSLNAAIANRYYTFPAPIGKVYANENFRVIAAANTFGQGATSEYVGRNQLDAASLDRFAIVRVDYDGRIEENLAGGDTDLLNFCRAFRKETVKGGIQAVVSYRAIGRLAKMSKLLETGELLETCLLRSLDVDDLNAIKNGVQGYGAYSTAFNTILQNRKNEA